MAKYRRALEIKEKYQEELFKIPEVTGVGIGLKIVDGNYTDEFSIRVHVVNKKPPGEVKPEEMIPKEIEGVETDVIEEGYAEPQVEAYKGGIKIECAGRGGSGTLGCFAQRRGSGEPVLLTNQHVLFKGYNVTANGEKVYQPFESSCCTDAIATVDDNAVLNVDAGIARLKPGVKWLAEIKDINGPIRGMYEIPRKLPPSALRPWNLKVEKTGKRTGHTTGWVDQVHTAKKTTGRPRLNDCLVVKPGTFSARGDSGSVYIYDDSGSKRVVGLHCCGTRDKKGKHLSSYGTHIKAVVDKLKIDIATATATGQVNTVPGASTPGSSRAPLSGGGEVGFGTTPFPNQAQALRQAEKDILATPYGYLLQDLYKKHVEEIRCLVNNNRRVAAVWQRNNGPAFINRVIYCVRYPEREFPNEINDLLVKESMERISEILKKYGSESLRRDVDKYREVVASMCGMTYSHILERMRDGTMFQELGISPIY